MCKFCLKLPLFIHWMSFPNRAKSVSACLWLQFWWETSIIIIPHFKMASLYRMWLFFPFHLFLLREGQGKGNMKRRDGGWPLLWKLHIWCGLFLSLWARPQQLLQNWLTFNHREWQVPTHIFHDNPQDLKYTIINIWGESDSKCDPVFPSSLFKWQGHFRQCK